MERRNIYDGLWNKVRYRGVSRNGDYFSDEYKQYLCFSVKSSFNLTHRRNRQNWTDAQQETHDLIKSLHYGGMGYRKIAQHLNERDIKTARGNSWKNTQVFSVLKRYRQRQNREEVRETPLDIEFGKMELVWMKEEVLDLIKRQSITPMSIQFACSNGR